MTGIAPYSTTPASNTSIAGINIAEGCPPSGINDAIRQLMADIATDVPNKNVTTNFNSGQNWAKAADVPSAATTPIGAAAGNYVHVTGTTNISAFDTVQAGTWRAVKFTGALTLSNGVIALPGSVDIAVTAGDTGLFVSEGSGSWVCIAYQSGTSSVSSGTSNQLAYYASSGRVVSGTTALPSGTTATTQTGSNSSTLVATTAQVQAAIALLTGFLTPGNNLSDLASKATALTNLGFVFSLGANGYVKIPNPNDLTKPLIIQWGSISSTGAVSFPIAFPNNIYTLVFGEQGIGYLRADAGPTLSGFTAGAGASSWTTGYWLAVGN